MSDEPENLDDDVGNPWFPDRKLQWRLDVVTLLAVIGESSMEEHSQAITSSAFCLFPRILPAPQALLKASRPQRMPETKAVVTGVESGIALESISFFASILIPMDLPAYGFRVLEIKHSVPPCPAPGAPTTPAAQTGLFGRLKGLFGGEEPTQRSVDVESASTGRRGEESPDASAPGTEGAIEIKSIRRQNTFREKVENTLVSGGRNQRPAIPARLGSPLHMLTLFSFLVSCAILASAIVWRDGTAIVSIFFLSISSSIVSYATWWQPRLMSVEGTETRRLPDGDIMIRTREGAFLYIRCKEDVARELFSGTDECKYRVNGGKHNLLMASGTVILMLAIVLLGNCKWNSQMFIAAAYIVLNGLYWGLGMLPKKYFWDLSRYDIRDVTRADAENAHKRTQRPRLTQGRGRSFTKRMTSFSRVGSSIAQTLDPVDDDEDTMELVEPDSRACFTRTLWFAIRDSRSVEWVGRNKAAPNTPVWNKWLEEAAMAARRGDRKWAAVARKDELIEEAQREKERERERDMERGRTGTIQEER